MRRPPTSALFPYTALFRSAPPLLAGGRRVHRGRLPAARAPPRPARRARDDVVRAAAAARADEVLELRPPHAARSSEEHTSELQSRHYLVCRLLIEKNTYDG